MAPDPLSSTVLALGLVCLPAHPLEPMLVTSRDSDEPVVLTLSQLRRWPLPPLAPTARLYVVENPSIIAAAANRAWSGPPIVCSSGRPTVAVVTLLRQLGARGATLHQHADFDAAGLAISGWLAERAGTVPWRMSAADYTAAVEVARRRLPLRGTLPPTDWDRALGDAMRGAGTRRLRGGAPRDAARCDAGPIVKLLHTSDWHVGKAIRGASRADEHRAVLAEIAGVAERRVGRPGDRRRRPVRHVDAVAGVRGDRLPGAARPRPVGRRRGRDRRQPRQRPPPAGRRPAPRARAASTSSPSRPAPTTAAFWPLHHAATAPTCAWRSCRSSPSGASCAPPT